MKTALLKRLGLAAILAGVSFAMCFALASVAQAQTQTATLTLQWVDNSAPPNNEDGFIIERAPATTGPFALLATVAPNATTYADVIANDPGGQQFCYRLLAFNTAGKSAYSNVACGLTPAVKLPPGAPSGMTITVTVTVTVP